LIEIKKVLYFPGEKSTVARFISPMKCPCCGPAARPAAAYPQGCAELFSKASEWRTQALPTPGAPLDFLHGNSLLRLPAQSSNIKHLQ
jgi:hypothetical protein